MKELGLNSSEFLQTAVSLLPFVLITQAQVRAILERDGKGCLFPDEHECKGKISVHHIDGKEDSAENLSTVCRNAHWEYLHNGKPKEKVLRWRKELKEKARERTKEIKKSGWVFPE